MIKKRRPGGGATTAKKKWQLELDAEEEPAGPKGGAIVCAGAACKSAPQLFCLGRDACKPLFCPRRNGFPASLCEVATDLLPAYLSCTRTRFLRSLLHQGKRGPAAAVGGEISVPHAPRRALHRSPPFRQKCESRRRKGGRGCGARERAGAQGHGAGQRISSQPGRSIQAQP